MSCEFVTQRAESGPCEAILLGEPRGEMHGHERESNCHSPLHDCPGYLGPVLARCGLEQRQHCTPQRLRLNAHGHHAFAAETADA